MLCEYCGKEHDGSFSTGRFCNRTCQARGSYRKHNPHLEKKIILCPRCHKPFLTGNCSDPNRTRCPDCRQLGPIHIPKPGLCQQCGKEHDGTFGSGRFCSKSCANTQIHSQETKNKIRQWAKDHPNKIKESSEKTRIISLKNRIHYEIKKICPICKKEFKVYENSKTIFCSRTCYRLDQKYGYKYSKKPTYNGQPKNPTSAFCSYCGWYKDIWCQSTYELVWVIYNLDHNIKFIRNSEAFKYIYENKEHKYYPDFYLSDLDEFVEIKGFIRPGDKEKWEQFPKKLDILFRKDIKHCFEYVSTKYNTENYNTLYTKAIKEVKSYACLWCGKITFHKCCCKSHGQLNYHSKKRLKTELEI